MALVDVERIGGFGGFGSPGSHLRSRGIVETSDLSHDDQQALEALFDNSPGGGDLPDAFKYRLTRQTAQGPQTVEIAEHHVPEAVRATVKDELV
jgi:hypothetical protein